MALVCVSSFPMIGAIRHTARRLAVASLSRSDVRLRRVPRDRRREWTLDGVGDGISTSPLRGTSLILHRRRDDDRHRRDRNNGRGGGVKSRSAGLVFVVAASPPRVNVRLVVAVCHRPPHRTRPSPNKGPNRIDRCFASSSVGLGPVLPRDSRHRCLPPLFSPPLTNFLIVVSISSPPTSPLHHGGGDW
jgi:hypothetical protein